MPPLSPQDQAKLDVLRAAQRDGGFVRDGEMCAVRVAELVAVFWPQPTGTVYYSGVQADELFPELQLSPVEARLSHEDDGPFRQVGHEAGISDDKVDLDLWDGDGKISDLFQLHGAGVRVEIFYYFPDVDLLLSQWWGHLQPPEDADEERFVASAEQGFRSSMLPLPRRAHFSGCQAVFGGLLTTQAEIDEGDCPYSAHLGGTPSARFGTDSSWKQTLAAGDGWQDAGFDDSGWAAAVEEGGYGDAPWGTEANFPAGTVARWVWYHDSVSAFDNAAEVYFRKTFVAAEAEALLVITADGYFTAYLNGVQVASGAEWRESVSKRLTLVPGETYVLAVKAGNAWTIPTPGGLLAEVAYGITGVGVGLLDPATGMPFTSCPRNSPAACTARLGDALSYLAFDTVVETMVNNQTKGTALLATSRGNETNLKKPVRVIAGRRIVRDLQVLAYTPQANTNHPDQGYVRAVMEISEGRNRSVRTCKINDQVIPPQHLNTRNGARRQGRTAFSPNVSNYSGTSLFYGVYGPVNPADNGPSNLRGEAEVEGKDDVRVYTSETDFTEQYTNKRAWWLLEALRNKRWGYGLDVGRLAVREDFVDVLAPYDDETVSFTGADGTLYTGPRTRFNAELNDRSAQQQINDICAAGRYGLPFPHEGKLRVVPLKKVDDLSACPVFADYGDDRNIVREGGKSTLKRSVVNDRELPNLIVLTFDDEEHGNVERPLTFEDVPQQLLAGRAFGDTSRRVVEKKYGALGVTTLGEAGRYGNLLLDLGEFDEGGLRNNLRVSFTTWYAFTLELHKYKVIRVLSRQLERYKQEDGTPFEYFRIRSMRRLPNLLVEISAQAYPRDYYERLENVILPPPREASGALVNPGGARGGRPRRIGFSEVGHGSDYISFLLQQDAA